MRATHTTARPDDTALTGRPSLPDPTSLAGAVDKLLHVDGPRYRRLWAYYRNPITPRGVDRDDAGADRPYRQAQEWGLPSRITGVRAAGSGDASGGQPVDGVARKEVVVENDIAWRVDTLVDALFGKPIVLNSAAPDPSRRAAISELLRLVLAQNGGVLFLQQLALLGAVYGFVDVLVKLDPCACDAYHAWARERQREDAGDRAAPLGHAVPSRTGPRRDEEEARETSDEAPAPVDASSCNTASLGSPPVAPPDGRAPSEHTGSAPAEATAPEHPDPGADATPPVPQAQASPVIAPDALPRLARMIRLEVVEPARALPALSPHDYRQVDAYCQVYRARRPATSVRRLFKAAWIDRVKRSATGLLGAFDPADPTPPHAHPLDGTDGVDVLVVDVLSAERWRRYEDGRLVAEGENALGVLPLVHVQNVAVPFEYAGASDVEPLLPLQDELNTRLSDRAHRITMQSFRMYLGKGIDGFATMPVAPGRMWSTDNPDADVIEFGGDSAAPSEDAHIAELREALDKTSGVNPIAAGAIKGRIGRLTSAAALRVTMQTLLAKTEKKRTTYGGAIERICELALAWLDAAGAFATAADERKVEIAWPSPLPENDLEKLQEAEAKLRLGVDRAIVLRELGY